MNVNKSLLAHKNKIKFKKNGRFSIYIGNNNT